MRIWNPDECSLSDFMEFDLVIRVSLSGQVWATDIYPPEIYDGGQVTDGWELVSGYSGQHGYYGPIMHPSEFIGGGLEAHILANPGYYVALVIYDVDDPEGDLFGWAVAYREEA